MSDEAVLQLERQLLPQLLLDGGKYASAAAELEAEGVKENRLQNLAITLNKAAFFLRHQSPALQQVVTCKPVTFSTCNEPH